MDRLDESRNTFRSALRRAQAGIATLAAHDREAGPTEDAPATTEADIDRLARLPLLEYGKCRKSEAKRLGVTVMILDAAVERRRKELTGETSTGQGQVLHLEDIEPADEPVDGHALLSNLAAAIGRYVVLPPGAALATALWTLWTYCHKFFDCAPRLALLSPEKRCGKTTLLRLIAMLTPRSLPASNISSAALFRTIEKAHPTLLVDEFDSFGQDNDELRGILNSGHTRDAAFVIRVVGDDHEPRQFSTWCPLVVAGIGRLPDTLADRSIVISMKRRMKGEAVEKLSTNGPGGQVVREAFTILARQCARWIQDHGEAIQTVAPSIPSSLNDRAADNWRPLLAIADVIGGDWPQRARDAASKLSGGGAEDDETVKVQLLADLRSLFEQAGADRMTSALLCENLKDMEERPWGGWKSGRPITPAQLARLLRGFGVSSRTIRLGEDCAKGYLRQDFEDAFSRYLQDCDVSKRDNVTTCSQSGDEALFQSVTKDECYASENATIPAPEADCHAVTDQNAVSQEEETISEVNHAPRSHQPAHQIPLL